MKFNENKIKAIKEAVRPEDQKTVRSSLGLTNYLKRFIHDYSTKTFTLRLFYNPNIPQSTENHFLGEMSFKNYRCNKYVTNKLLTGYISLITSVNIVFIFVIVVIIVVIVIIDIFFLLLFLLFVFFTLSFRCFSGREVTVSLIIATTVTRSRYSCSVNFITIPLKAD